LSIFFVTFSAIFVHESLLTETVLAFVATTRNVVGPKDVENGCLFVSFDESTRAAW